MIILLAVVRVYYYDEIIDSRVFDLDGNDIGVVSEIMTTGANDVWVVQRPGQKDALIPMIDDVVKNVDVDNKRITIVRFKKGAELQVETKDGFVPFKVKSSRLHKNMWLVLFEGVNNINDIEKYKTHDVYVYGDARETLGDDVWVL
ncbi:16S rRNA processing protein RimM|uniref:16S rRNA processing protein RimM n=1 Tax=Leuconostoc lactis TaxID=1246 RepID=A0A6L7AD55_LEULA|nr:16S rRNA processing protein RimM [Leuconostoc lactis]